MIVDVWQTFADDFVPFLLITVAPTLTIGDGLIDFEAEDLEI